jgi:hypothetical protein
MRFTALLVTVSACHQDAASQPVLTPQTRTTPSTTAVADPTEDAGAPAEPVVITVIAPGTLEIENTGSTPVSLQTNAPIMRDHVVGTYRLIDRCPDTAPACVEIPAGGMLRPVAWTGFSCSAQCNVDCDKNVYLGDKDYFFTVKTCDGARAIPSKTFTMPRDSRSGPFQRFAFVSDSVSATVARLELPEQAFALGAPATPDHIAGFRVKPGTEKPIDAARMRDFLTLVGFSNGFDDEIAKRCLMSDLVGVRVVRHPRTTGSVVKEDVVEYAFDQTCSKFFAVRGDSSHRVEMATHYDPQRPAFLAWAKRALSP